MYLRWKKEPKATGLRAVGAGPRGSVLHDGSNEYASINPVGGDWRGPLRGWYWVAFADTVGEHKNTCNDIAPDEATAKVQAMEFVKAKLAASATTTTKGRPLMMDPPHPSLVLCAALSEIKPDD